MQSILIRIFDLIFSFIALTVLSPVLILVSILIRINLGKGIFFIQERVGLNEKVFKLIKFRTMSHLSSTKNTNQIDIERIGRLGHFLRTTSLDELPELLNVIKGDMSIVGPRPLLVKYIPLYNEFQRTRHHVLPGITGWAQVNGRNGIDWNKRFDLDVWYVKNRTFLLNIRIILMSFWTILSRKNVNANNRETMTSFKGNNKSE